MPSVIVVGTIVKMLAAMLSILLCVVAALRMLLAAANSVALPEAGRKIMLRWLWLAVVVIVLDQLSKYIANSELILYSPQVLLPGLNFTLSYNEGAAFSFLSDAGGWQRWLFIGLALFVSTFIVLWLYKLKPSESWLAIALVLILGGALGNVWDRVYLGYVVDFIDIYFHQWHWPAFNIADSAITVGAVMLLIDGLRGDHKNTEK
jgi:signal peptidase II